MIRSGASQQEMRNMIANCLIRGSKPEPDDHLGGRFELTRQDETDMLGSAQIISLSWLQCVYASRHVHEITPHYHLTRESLEIYRQPLNGFEGNRLLPLHLAYCKCRRGTLTQYQWVA
jgi:hypothetical protein